MCEDSFNMIQQGEYDLNYLFEPDFFSDLGSIIHDSQCPCLSNQHNPFQLPESLNISGISNKFERKNRSFISKGPSKISELKEYKRLFIKTSESLFLKFDNFIAYLSDDNGILSEKYSRYWLELGGDKETAENLMKELCDERIDLFTKRLGLLNLFEKLDDLQGSFQVNECSIEEVLNASEEFVNSLRHFSDHVSRLRDIIAEFVHYVETNEIILTPAIAFFSQFSNFLYESDVSNSDTLSAGGMLNHSNESINFPQYGIPFVVNEWFPSTANVSCEPSDPPVGVNVSKLFVTFPESYVVDNISIQT